jgi:hypothetical protein
MGREKAFCFPALGNDFLFESQFQILHTECTIIVIGGKAHVTKGHKYT